MACGGTIHTINSDPNIARLQGYTIGLYKEIEELSGQSCGIHRPGGIYLAATPERLDYLKQERAKARYMGLETDFISLEEARDLNPLIDPTQISRRAVTSRSTDMSTLPASPMPTRKPRASLAPRSTATRPFSLHVRAPMEAGTW